MGEMEKKGHEKRTRYASVCGYYTAIGGDTRKESKPLRLGPGAKAAFEGALQVKPILVLGIRRKADAVLPIFPQGYSGSKPEGPSVPEI